MAVIVSLKDGISLDDGHLTQKVEETISKFFLGSSALKEEILKEYREQSLKALSEKRGPRTAPRLGHHIDKTPESHRLDPLNSFTDSQDLIRTLIRRHTNAVIPRETRMSLGKQTFAPKSSSNKNPQKNRSRKSNRGRNKRRR